MDNFDLKKYLAEGKLLKEGFYSSPSDMDESGLNVIPKNSQHTSKAIDAFENSGLYYELEGDHLFFPEETDLYDQLESQIQRILDENNIEARIEGVWFESLKEVKYNFISSEEFEKYKNIKSFNPNDYEWDEGEGLYKKKSLKEEDGGGVDSLFNKLQSQLKAKYSKDEKTVTEIDSGTLFLLGYFAPMFILILIGLFARELEDFGEWGEEKLMPKIKRLLRSDRKIKKILSRLRNNPEAMEAITNAPRGKFRDTVKKFITDEEVGYLYDVTRKNIKTGEVSDDQLRKVNLAGKTQWDKIYENTQSELDKWEGRLYDLENMNKSSNNSDPAKQKKTIKAVKKKIDSLKKKLNKQ